MMSGFVRSLVLFLCWATLSASFVPSLPSSSLSSLITSSSDSADGHKDNDRLSSKDKSFFLSKKWCGVNSLQMLASKTSSLSSSPNSSSRFSHTPRVSASENLNENNFDASLSSTENFDIDVNSPYSDASIPHDSQNDLSSQTNSTLKKKKKSIFSIFSTSSEENSKIDYLYSSQINKPNSNLNELSKPSMPFKSSINSKSSSQSSRHSTWSYLWLRTDWKRRISLILSMACLGAAKLLSVEAPFLLTRAVDFISSPVSQNTVAKNAAKRVLKNVGNRVVYSATKNFVDSGFSLASLTSLFELMGVNRFKILYFISYYILYRVLSTFLNELKTCFFAQVSFNSLKLFANEIFTHLHVLDAGYHLQVPSGVISIAYIKAMRGFQIIMSQYVFSVLPVIVEFFLVIFKLWRTSGSTYALTTSATFISYFFFTVWITEFRVKLRRQLLKVDNKRNGFFIDSILNHEVVKFFTNEKLESQKYNDYLEQIRKLNVKTTYIIAALNIGQGFIFSTGLAVSLFVSIYRVSKGLMSVGDMLAINSLLLQLATPFDQMGETYQELKQARVDVDFMFNTLTNVKSSIEVSSEQSQLLPDINDVAPLSGPSKIEFRNVFFRYPSHIPGSKEYEENEKFGPDVLHNVSFTVEAGQNVAIVGPSGSGKSTTLRLVTRMFDAYSGNVLVDGVDTKDVNVKSLRQRVAVVPQDNSLFGETVEYNIKYGNSSATEQDVERVIQSCDLKETIQKLPEGLQTNVGERGSRLSGGERQKISIARALLKNPTAILCDEVTSAVDAFAEKDITDCLRRARDTRTTITIAHRLSSIMHCDKIIVMSHGKVIEEGSHKQLLKAKGEYYHMWKVQNNPVK